MDPKNETIYKRCLSLLNEEEIINFLGDLIKIQSFPPDFNEKDVALAVAKKFAEYGVNTQIDDLGANRANLIATMGQKARPNLVYGGHFDTVPPINEGWNHDPFGAEIVDNRMFGRGACDMKSGVAAMVMAMCILNRAGAELSGQLTFLGTAGEEVGCFGAKAYNDKYGSDDIDAMAISEATNRKMFFAEKGALWIKFTTYGKAAHPGVSWEGINSLEKMLRFLNEFGQYQFTVQEHNLLGSPTLNITTLHSGTITNALPIISEATVDIRTVPGIEHQDILKDIDIIVSRLKETDENFHLEYEVLNDFKPIETSLDDRLSQIALYTHENVFDVPAEAAGIYYFTDAVAFASGKPIPLIIYGPGNPLNNHKVNEYVDLLEVIDCTKFYIMLALNYLT